MAPQVIDDLVAEATAVEGVIDSAVLVINGIQARIDAAVAAAIANGATAAQLAPVAQVSTDLKAKSDALATAVAANPGT